MRLCVVMHSREDHGMNFVVLQWCIDLYEGLDGQKVTQVLVGGSVMLKWTQADRRCKTWQHPGTQCVHILAGSHKRLSHLL